MPLRAGGTDRHIQLHPRKTGVKRDTTLLSRI